MSSLPTSPTSVIHTQALTKRFGAIIAVDHLDLAVQAGEIFGLVGPDGAGKTTTLRMLAGVMTPTAGSATVLGYDVVREAAGLRRHVGYLAQRFALYGDLTVAENIRFFGDVYGVPRDAGNAWAGQILAFSGLSPFQHRLADNLSGGMKQKLALSCALIHRPRVLLLDEPTAGVDPVSRRDLWRILYRLQADGYTIVLSTAYMDEAERCNRVGLLANGRLVIQGTPDALRHSLTSAQPPYGKSIIEVSLADATALNLRLARELALSLPTALGAQLFGDRLHVLVEATTQADEVAQAIGAQVAVGHAAAILPTLEDVFLAARPEYEGAR